VQSLKGKNKVVSSAAAMLGIAAAVPN